MKLNLRVRGGGGILNPNQQTKVPGPLLYCQDFKKALQGYGPHGVGNPVVTRKEVWGINDRESREIEDLALP